MNAPGYRWTNYNKQSNGLFDIYLHNYIDRDTNDIMNWLDY